MQFRIEYVDIHQGTWGYRGDDGTWSHSYGALQRREVDLGIGGYFGAADPYWDFDMTYPYMEDKIKWLVPTAQKLDDVHSLRRVFEKTVWMLLLISFIYFSVGLYFGGKYLLQLLMVVII